MSSVKKISICSICIALCYILPLVFHAFALGSVFSPMHISVFLCGLICGWPYGFFCGIAGPIVSSLISGMPSTVQLVYMIPELCVYGLASGLLIKRINTRHIYVDLYLALIPAMLLGRMIGGAARAIFYFATSQTYSLMLWASAYFFKSIPGIILHLMVIPTLVVILMKVRLIPMRYSTPISHI